MDKEIDLDALAQPTIDMVKPIFEKRLVALSARMTDEADETERSCHTRLQRQVGLAPLHSHLRIVRAIVNRTSIQQHSANAETLQDCRQSTGVRLTKPIWMTDF